MQQVESQKIPVFHVFAYMLVFTFSLAMSACGGGGSSGSTSEPTTPEPVTPEPVEPEPPVQTQSKIYDFLIKSDGSRSLGDTKLAFNNTRDTGSKIVYFDTKLGNNATADYYWWNGKNIVDSQGRTANPDNKETYGTDPLFPNESAIKSFATFTLANDASDDRLRTQAGRNDTYNNWRFSGVAGGYPDWFLFRRGQMHTEFSRYLVGGRSEAEPMVVSAYGKLADGRAVFAPEKGSPLYGHNWGRKKSWLHQAIFSLEFRTPYGFVGVNTADTHAKSGGPVTAYLEDCKWPSAKGGVRIVYPPKKTMVKKSVVTGVWNPDNHNQGYFTGSFQNQVTFDEVILYRNGYKTDPITDPYPRRTVFDRNIYQGGGAKMGHTYRNIISAHGGSGGPQMRFGGTLENSLVVEGYVYSGTRSNPKYYPLDCQKKDSPVACEKKYYLNPWLVNGGQVGQSAVVKNNVQLVYAYSNDYEMNEVIGKNDKGQDITKSDERAQPGWGYRLSGASFGAEVEGNIITGAMLANDLSKDGRLGLYGLNLNMAPDEEYHADIITENVAGKVFSQKNNTLKNNIFYGVRTGVQLKGEDMSEVSNINISDNVFVAKTPLNDKNLDEATKVNQLALTNNRFYSDSALPQNKAWLGSSNTQAAYDTAKTAENWSDPDRTLKRYVTEVLGLTLLEWSDNTQLDVAEKQKAINAGFPYDPSGVKTFMAVATNMRHGGADAIPSSGKPDMLGDYPWDERFTASAVVNWVRAGFNQPPVMISKPTQ